MNNNKIDDDLIKWNDIFDELLIDATTLIQDFSTFINWPVFFVFLLFCLGSVAVIIPIVLGRDLQIVLAGVVIGVSCIPSGLAILQYWHKMKNRYNKMFAMVEKAKSN